jgi:lysophospholipase L1-like esterase
MRKRREVAAAMAGAFVLTTAAGCGSGAHDTAPPLAEGGENFEDARSGLPPFPVADAASTADVRAASSEDASDEATGSLDGWTTAVESGSVDASETSDAETTADASLQGDAGTYQPCPGGGSPCVIMPLGDSITYGYGSTTGGGYRVELFTLAVAAGPSITFVGSGASGPDTVAGKPFPKENEGHPGYTIDDSTSPPTTGISPLVDHAMATYKPNVILLLIGTNDMHYQVDVANAPTRLGALIDQIIADAPQALVVVSTLIPAKGAQDVLTQAYNAKVPGVVQERAAAGKHVTLVDMYPVLKVWSYADYSDSEHPNDTGYSLMGQAWYAALRPFLR